MTLWCRIRLVNRIIETGHLEFDEPRASGVTVLQAIEGFPAEQTSRGMADSRLKSFRKLLMGSPNRANCKNPEKFSPTLMEFAIDEAVETLPAFVAEPDLAASALALATLALAESKWLNRALHEIGREENLCFLRPGAGATAPFALMPNARANPDVSWAPLDGQNIALSGPAWSDIITVEAAELHISGRKGTVSQRLAI